MNIILYLVKFKVFYNDTRTCKISLLFLEWTSYQKKISKRLIEQEEFNSFYHSLSMWLRNSLLSQENMFMLRNRFVDLRKSLKENMMIFQKVTCTMLIKCKKR